MSALKGKNGHYAGVNPFPLLTQSGHYRYCAGRALSGWTKLRLAKDLLCSSIRRAHPGRTLGVTALLLALGLGFVAGLRTITPVAAVMLARGGIWGIVLAVAA